ncbi:MAG: hypothetical protein ACRDQX_10490, partial [Pseudonocardiaceae bacterium]
PSRHPDEQAPSGTPPTGPAHVTDIRTINDAVIYILSGGQHTHHGMQGPDQTVTAVCGVRFTPRPLREPLPGHPPDPEQICPQCELRRKAGAR